MTKAYDRHEKIPKDARRLLALLREAGATVVSVHRTGEGRVTHPKLGKPVRFNARRKDAAGSLLIAYRKVSKPGDGAS